MTNYQKMKPIHPGEILREEFLVPLKLSVEQLAQDIKFSLESCQKVVNEREALSMDLICRLSAYFDLPVEFWGNLQKRYELGISVGAGELARKRQEINPYKEIHRSF